MIEYKTSGFTQEEIRQAVRIQIQEIPKGFLSSLGEKPLTLIFSHIASSRFGIMVIAKEADHGRVIGYVFGATNTRQLYKDFLVKRTFQAVFYFLPKLLSWERIKKAFETLLYPVQKRGQNTKDCDAELLDLAVIQAYQGKGIAQRLFEGFTSQCRARNIGCFEIPTSEGLARAHRFYEKVGAYRVGSLVVHGDQQTYIYRYHVQE